MDLGIGGAAASAALPVNPVDYEQGPLVGGPEVGDIYYVGTDFCFRMPDLRRLDEEVDELMGSNAAVSHWGIEEARSVRAGSMNANYAPQVRSFPLQ